MPIHRVKLPNGEMGYKWGAHGHAYPTQEGAQAQEKAAYANGYTGDGLTTAAGICLTTPDGKMLFVKDSGRETWCFPGGKAEFGEDAETTARRELLEETGIAHDGPIAELNRHIFQNVDYTTFTAPIQSEVDPDLDGENTAFVWAGKDELPQPLHPAITEFMTEKPAQDAQLALDKAHYAGKALALDRAPMEIESARFKDRDGRLHVKLTNISKANVCPYRGSEIPGWKELGLDPDKIYQLYRHPDELAKAAHTFNGQQVLSEHVPVDVNNSRPDITIGATGTNAVFEAPYLKNSLTVWDKDAIENIETDRQKEISCAYYYTPDMTPGEVDGQPYDGVMRDIVANHVAVVVEGRAGSDVVIGDSAMENDDMPRAIKGRQKRTREAIFADVRPLLAADATIDDLNLLLEKLEPNMPEEEYQENPAVEAAEPVKDNDPVTQAKELIKANVTPEVFAQIEALLTGGNAVDEDLPEAGIPVGDEDYDEEKPITQAAMDAAIKAVKETAMKQFNAVREAERAVKPFVGELAMSFDSAESVYRHALKALGVAEADKIHASALPTILGMQSKPIASRQGPAMDAKPKQSFADRFPGAKHLA